MDGERAAHLIGLLVRCDSSAVMGTGHVMRCLALATELAKRGFRPVFASRPLPGHIGAVIQHWGFDLRGLPDSEPLDEVADARACAALADGTSWAAVLVDHYQLGAAWEQAMKAHAGLVIAIDDLADRSHAASLLIDHNLQAPGRYDRLLPPGALTLLGPRHALLREEFRDPPLRTPAADGRARVLVSLGGADADGVTLEVVQALAQVNQPMHVTVIGGPRNPHGAAIEQACRQQGYDYLASSEQMAALMREADFGVGAGGVSLLERCAMGLPSVTVLLADNQRAGSRMAAEAGATSLVEQGGAGRSAAIAQAAKALLGDAAARARMAAAARKVCDGEGCRRVAEVVQREVLQLRPAAASDAQMLFDWRNAPEVRRYSGDGQPIAFGSHRDWLARTLADPDRVLWIAEAGGQPQGVLRFDRQSDASARISVYRVPGAPGIGWGRALIARGVREIAARWPGLQSVEAEVSDDNAASLKAFAACGFTPHGAGGLYRVSIEGRPA